jgi:hypothetical protein
LAAKAGRMHRDGGAESTYRIEFKYLEVPAEEGPNLFEEAHCEFLIRFNDVPVGAVGHCAFFCVNVVTSETARQLGIRPRDRAYLVSDYMTQAMLRKRVTDDVTRAMNALHRSVALPLLDRVYVWRDRDFRDEFSADVLDASTLRGMIEDAFAGVSRGQGVTLHEALAEDDYADPVAKAAARALDTDTDWHDAPRDVMIKRCEFFSYLDPLGFRYYLPATMLLCLDPSLEGEVGDTPQRTYWSLLPTVAPRDFGKGHGKRFSSEAFIASCGFTDAQVHAIYRFLCFMAIEADQGVNEEQLPALRQWRGSAASRPSP